MDAMTGATTGIAAVLGGDIADISEGPQDVQKASEAAIGRVLDVLKHLGAPAELKTIQEEVNLGADQERYLASGVIEAALEALVRVGKAATSESSDSPPRTLYALLAEQTPPPFDDKAPGLSAEARAAVATVLGGQRAYVAGTSGEPDLSADPESPYQGFDVAQVAFAVTVAATSEGDPPIAIPPVFASAFMDGLDPSQPTPIEERARVVLQALVATAPQLVLVAEESFYTLSAAGQRLFAERGALALAEATMAPKPAVASAEDRLAALEASHLEYEKRLNADYDRAIAQRDLALRSLEDKSKSLDHYRAWFERHNLTDPDQLVASRASEERKIVKGYTIELAVDLEEHLRVVGEFDLAERALAATLARHAEQVAKMKEEKDAAENRVTSLKAMVKVPPNGERHVVVKDVYKVVEEGRLAVYSADPHDEGKIVCYEPIPRNAQMTLPQTGVAVTVPDAPTRRSKKRAEPAASVAEQAPPSAAAAVADTSDSDDMKPDYAGVVRSFLVSYGPTTAEAIAAKLDIQVADVIRAVATLGDRLKQTGNTYELAKKPDATPSATPSAAGPSKKRGSLDPETVDTNIHDLLGEEPHRRHGMQLGDFPRLYCEFVDLKHTGSIEKLVLARLDLAMKRDAVARGEGGDDTIIWRGDLPDPRQASSEPSPSEDDGNDAPAAATPKRGRGPDKQPRKRRGEGKAEASA